MGCTASVGIAPHTTVSGPPRINTGNGSGPASGSTATDTTPVRILATRGGIDDTDTYTISHPDGRGSPDPLSATHMRMIRSISRNRVREIDTVVGGGLLSHKQDMEFSTSGMASARSSRLGISSQYPFLSPSHNPHAGSIDVLTMSHHRKMESGANSTENSIIRNVASPTHDDGASFRRRRMSDFRSSSRSSAPSPTMQGRGGRMHTVHVSTSAAAPPPPTVGSTTPPHGSGRNSPHSRRNMSIGSRPPELDLAAGTSFISTVSATNSPTHHIQVTAPTLNPRRSSMPSGPSFSSLPSSDTLGTGSLYGSLASLASSPEFQHATPSQQQHLLQTIHTKEQQQIEISQGVLLSRRGSGAFAGALSVSATPRSAVAPSTQQQTAFAFPPSPSTIPHTQSQTGSSSPPSSQTRVRARGKRMALIVDNVAVSQRLNSVALYRAGYTCEHAADGETAIQMAMETHYDLIFIDLALPTLTGIQVCQQIRAYENRQGEIPSLIIGLTSTVDNNNLKQYQLARMNAVIEKGCIISQVIPDLIRTLASNSNFLFVNARHIKSQAPKTDADSPSTHDLGVSSIGRHTQGRLRIDPSPSHGRGDSTASITSERSTPLASPSHTITTQQQHPPLMTLDGLPMLSTPVAIDTIAPAVTDQDQMAALASVTLKRRGGGSGLFQTPLVLANS